MKREEDILHHHYEALNNYGAAKAKLIETDSGLPEDVSELFKIVHYLRDFLTPVQPESDFRTGLRVSLVAEAERRRVQKALGFERVQKGARPGWLVPVAALGTASLVGAYAYWRRTRQAAGEEQPLAA